MMGTYQEKGQEMSTGSTCHWTRSRFVSAIILSALLLVSTIILSALLLVMGSPPDPAAGEPDVRNHGSATTIKGVVVDEKAKPQADVLVRCSDFEDPPANGVWPSTVILGEAFSDEKGEFTLPISPITADKIWCWIDGGNVYETDEKIIPIGRNGKVVFTLKFRTIPKLEGWVQIPKDWDIQKVLVLVHQSNDGIISRRPEDEQGKVVFENIKAGPATVEYSYDGLGMGVVERFLMEGSDISPTLRFASFPSALILLFPGIAALGLLAYISLRWRQDPDMQRRVGDPALMLASLVLWGVTFVALWFLLKSREGSGLHFFHPTLSFALSVPVFGFIGAMLFVIDFFRSGAQSAPDYREFALRLVLGPYVAIVMVLLFGGAFQMIDLTKLGSQATVAFFSGFLVVLALQTLAEKGNELLGQWRASARYEPSEIARQFNLQMEEDVKLQKAHLKYLEQLRALSKDELRTMAIHTELGEAFLVGLQKRLQEQDLLASQHDLLARLGVETWAKLKREGVREIGDVALLSSDRIQQIATNQQFDREALTAFCEACKKIFAQDAYQADRSRSWRQPSAA
jgi:hypothetical protein